MLIACISQPHRARNEPNTIARTPIRGNQTSVFRLVAAYHKHVANRALK
jgi:hypothetical protein